MELLAPLESNVCVFRYVDRFNIILGKLNGEQRTDQINEEILFRLQESGIAAPSGIDLFLLLVRSSNLLRDSRQWQLCAAHRPCEPSQCARRFRPVVQDCPKIGKPDLSQLNFEYALICAYSYEIIAALMKFWWIISYASQINRIWMRLFLFQLSANRSDQYDREYFNVAPQLLILCL
jgi:hypothetical protein